MAAAIRIVTDGGDLDLEQGAETQFYVTRQILNLNNFEARQSDFTKYLNVPATANNTTILGVAADASTDIEGGGDKLQCSIIMDGVTVAPIAFLIVAAIKQSKTASFYQIIMFYGNFNLFDELKGANINDLNWADLTLDWELADVIPKASNTYLDNDIVVPICDWYTRGSEPFLFTNNQADINLMGFFLYARNIIERMLSAAGFSLIVDPSVPAEFDLLALACPVTKFMDPQDFEGVSPVNSLVRSDINQVVSELNFVVMIFQTVLQDTAGIWDIPLNSFVLKDTQTYNVSCNGVYDHVKIQNLATDSTITLYQNGVILDQILITQTEANIPFRLSAEFAGIIGDIIQVRLQSGERLATFSTLTTESGSEFGIATPGTETSREVFIDESIPIIEQGAFLSNILKLYNLFITTDDVNKVVTLTAFDWLYTAESPVLSDQLSVSEPIDIKLSVQSLGAASIFQWGNDFLRRRDTDITLSYDNSLLDRTKIVIDMIFSACDNSTLFFSEGSDIFPKCKIPSCLNARENFGSISTASIYEITIQADGSYILSGEIADLNVGNFLTAKFGGSYHTYRVIQKVSDTTGTLQTPINISQQNQLSEVHYIYTPEPADFQQRLAIIRTDGFEALYAFTQGSSPGEVRLSAGDKSGQWLDSLQMSEVVTNQYKNILDALKTPQQITARFKISAVGVLTFDQRKAVYVDQFNAFYYVNKIEQFKVNTTTRLELIRISKLV